MKAGKVPRLEYYEAAPYGPHVFFVRALEYFITKLSSKGAKIGYQAFLERPLEDIEAFAEEAAAQEVPGMMAVVPMGGMSFLRNSIPGRQVPIRNGRRDLFLEFHGVTKHPVYVGRLSMLTPEFQSVGVITASVIIAHSHSEALEFLAEYYDSTRERNRVTKCVLGPDGEPVVNFREMTWDGIILPDGQAEAIRSEIDTFFSSRDMYYEHGLDWRRGLLLGGPPGNGKTSICRAIASTSKVPVVYCPLRDPDAFTMLLNAQSTIAKNSPCVVMFEDVNIFDSDPAVKSSFLNMMDGLYTCDGVFCVATTCHPDDMDGAFTGRPSRFDTYHIVSNPGPAEREKMLRTRLGRKARLLKDADIRATVKDTEDFSAASVQEVAAYSLLASASTGKPIGPKFLKDGVRKMRQHMRASKDGVEAISRGNIGFSQSLFPSRTE